MKNKKMKIFISLSTVIFFLSLSPVVISAKKNPGGNLIGYIFDLGKTKPIQGAIVKVKNVKDGELYISRPSNKRGAFEIEGMKSGIYVVGVITSEGDFNTDQLIGVYENQTLRVSFSMNPYKREVASAIQNVYKNLQSSGECYIGEVVKYLNNPGEAAIYVEKGIIQVGDRIHVKGYMTDFYQDIEELYVDGVPVKKALVGQSPIIMLEHPVDIGDLIYVIPKRRGLAAFFLAPSGIASVVAASSAIAYGVVTLAEAEAEESAFKPPNKK